jgi:Fe-S-cluster containining protein
LLEKLYASLPSIECQGLCHEACGPVSGSALEIRRLEAASGRKAGFDDDLNCNMLTPTKRCAGYEARPMVCRMFGLVKQMQCPHGCVPERWLSREEGFRLMAKAEGL